MSDDHEPVEAPIPDFHYWTTPMRLVRKALTSCLPPGFTPRTILDPGAGTLGNWGTVARSIWPDALIVGVEIREVSPPAAYDEWITANLMSWQDARRFDLVMGNPPFGTFGPAIIQAAVERSIAPGGSALFYYHQRFLATDARALWMEDYCPEYVWNVVPRPSHSSDGNTEKGGEYVVMRWRAGRRGPPYMTDFLRWRETRQWKLKRAEEREGSQLSFLDAA